MVWLAVGATYFSCVKASMLRQSIRDTDSSGAPASSAPSPFSFDALVVLPAGPAQCCRPCVLRVMSAPSNVRSGALLWSPLRPSSVFTCGSWGLGAPVVSITAELFRDRGRDRDAERLACRSQRLPRAVTQHERRRCAKDRMARRSSLTCRRQLPSVANRKVR